MSKPLQIFIFSILKTFTEKTFITFAFLLASQQLFAQVSDSFADGNFTNNPTWTGTTARFTISSGRLRLQAPEEAGEAHLATPSQALADASWEFSVWLGFDPSSANYARVYLASSTANLGGALQGYYVMVGNTDDEISLYRQTGTTGVKIIDGMNGRLAFPNSSMRIKVTRDAAGHWQLYTDVGITGYYTLEGATTDVTHAASQYAGVFCDYTATRSNLFYFDDIRIAGKPVPPGARPAYKDVIISEIMADPTPEVRLPDAEFVEIHNRSAKTFNLGGWILTDGTTRATLPAATLPAGGYAIITGAAVANAFTAYGPIAATQTFPSLNNAGDKIVLRMADSTVIDSVQYSDRWHSSADKRAGGWSLEIIDPNDLCGDDANWTASLASAGGTPGTQNSVWAQRTDNTGPVLVSVIPTDATHVTLRFNERLAAEVPITTNFTLSPAVQIASVSFADLSLRRLDLLLRTSLDAETTYTLTAQNIWDCTGNPLLPTNGHATFRLPAEPQEHQVVLNEVLFNPRPQGVDFVEIVNTSTQYFNLKGWALGHREDDQVKEAEVISEDDLLLPPGGYLVLTTDAATLTNHYPTVQHLVEMTLPSLNDDEGSVALTDSTGHILDSFHYKDTYHSPFLKDTEGVSLERISFSSATDAPDNWKSASTTAGYATPGYINSQARPARVFDDAVVITPEVFIPLTGHPDFTEIHYRLDPGGYAANVRIVDPHGRVVRELANNALLGSEGFLRWDGDCDDGTKARVGYYMVWVELIDPKGNVQTIRKRVAVAARLH
jgi:hypothetical protein